MSRKESFLLEVAPNLIFEKVESPFKPDYQETSRQEILDLIVANREMQLFNGACMRINNIEDLGDTHKVSVSPIGFFDYAATNLIYEEADLYLDQAKVAGAENILEYIENLRTNLSEKNRSKDFFQALDQPHLANPTAVSVLVEDETGRLGISQRGDKVAVNPNLYSVTATGMVDEADFNHSDPFLHAAYRELEEELGLETDKVSLQAYAWKVGIDDYQPIMLVMGTYQGQFSESNQGEEFSLENRHFKAYDHDQVYDLVYKSNKPMTPATRVQLKAWLDK